MDSDILELSCPQCFSIQQIGFCGNLKSTYCRRCGAVLTKSNRIIQSALINPQTRKGEEEYGDPKKSGSW